MVSFGPSFGDYLQTAKRNPRWHRRINSKQEPTIQARWRLLPAICLAIAAALFIAGRLWQLQVIEGQQQRQASLNNSLALEVIPAPRGIIFDQSGVVLARNEPTFRVAVTAAAWPRDEAASIRQIELLASILDLPTGTIEQRLEQARTSPFFPVTLQSNVDRDTEITLISQLDQLNGVSIGQDLRRSYPLGPAFSHVIGYTGSISQQDLESPQMSQYHPGEAIGKAGLEQAYQAELHGSIGQKFSQVNALGHPQQRQAEIEPQPGYNLHLSLDSQLQQHLYELLIKAMEDYDTTGASAVVQDPSTGRILSLISLPSYDNNLFAKGITSKQLQQLTGDPMRPLFDRSIAGTYPPGSTVKPLVAAAAIDLGVVQPETLVPCSSFISVGSFRYADWTYWLGRPAPGPMNAATAIAQSCDTYFYQIGGGYQSQNGMGVSALHRYFSLGGFGSLTGIDLPGEVRGVSPDPAWKRERFPDDPEWYIGNTYQLAIGQSYLLTTPLQVNNLTSAIANGGTLMRPTLVERLTNQQGQTIRQQEQQVLAENIVEETGLAVAQAGMIQSVEKGIVFPLRGNPMRPAAKTGTAEFGTPNARGAYQTHAWVTGYAPYDQPEISFTILLESGGSSTNAAEVADKLLDWYAVAVGE